jgi:hypothetical protein
MISQACEHKGVYYYVFPEFSQGRKVVWDGMTQAGERFLDYIPGQIIASLNQNEMKIRLINGSLIQIVGSDRYDALMGTNPRGCIFSEYSIQNPNAWQYLRPILDANGGWAIFVFTPRGANHSKDLFDMAKQDAHWFAQRLTNDDTAVFSDHQLEQMRKEGMTEDMIQQEIYCSFTLGIQGSYYAKYMEEAKEQNRVTIIPYDKSQLVHTAWDIGVGDATSIVFFQVAGKEIHIIDYYENNGEGLPHYIQILKSKAYLYGTHFAPHDIEAREFSSGHSRRFLAQKMGIEFNVLKSLNWSIEEGIELTRTMLPRMWFDRHRAAEVIKALENYRKEYDERRHIYKTKPLHDKYSHCADAIRYMCMGIRTTFEADRGPSDAEVDRLMDRHQPRFN